MKTKHLAWFVPAALALSMPFAYAKDKWVFTITGAVAFNDFHVTFSSPPSKPPITTAWLNVSAVGGGDTWMRKDNIASWPFSPANPWEVTFDFPTVVNNPASPTTIEIKWSPEYEHPGIAEVYLTYNGHHVGGVPEPAESALLLAGLGLMGVLARRKAGRRKSALPG